MVATQEGGIADFLFDAKRNPDQAPTGWAVDVDSPEQIKGAILDIMGHPEEVKKVVENAQALVRETYNWEHIVHRMKNEVFSKVLK